MTEVITSLSTTSIPYTVVSTWVCGPKFPLRTHPISRCRKLTTSNQFLPDFNFYGYRDISNHYNRLCAHPNTNYSHFGASSLRPKSSNPHLEAPTLGELTLYSSTQDIYITDYITSVSTDVITSYSTIVSTSSYPVTQTLISSEPWTTSFWATIYSTTSIPYTTTQYNTLTLTSTAILVRIHLKNELLRMIYFMPSTKPPE